MWGRVCIREEDIFAIEVGNFDVFNGDRAIFSNQFAAQFVVIVASLQSGLLQAQSDLMLGFLLVNRSLFLSGPFTLQPSKALLLLLVIVLRLDMPTVGVAVFVSRANINPDRLVGRFNECCWNLSSELQVGS